MFFYLETTVCLDSGAEIIIKANGKEMFNLCGQHNSK